MIIQRGKLSSASDRVLGVSGLRLGPASFLFPFRRVGEALLLWTAMLGAVRVGWSCVAGARIAVLLVVFTPAPTTWRIRESEGKQARKWGTRGRFQAPPYYR